MVFSLALHAQLDYTTGNRRAVVKFETAKRYYVLKDYQNSVKELTEALEADPEFIEAWLLLGQVQTDAGNLEESIVAYNRAVEIDPLFFPNVLFFLAENEMAVGKYYDARVHYEWFLALDQTVRFVALYVNDREVTISPRDLEVPAVSGCFQHVNFRQQ